MFRLIVFTLLFFPSILSAGWKDFLPRPLKNGMDLRFYAFYETDDNQIATNRLRWNDRFLKEKFSLYSDGYAYHPRFLLYHVSLAGSLKQESFDSDFAESTDGFRYASGMEFDMKLQFLPEHSYSLELFTRRLEPIYKEKSATQHQGVERISGAIFRFRKKPYFFNARYVHQKNEATFFSAADTAGILPVESEVKTFNLDGQYYKRYANGNEVSVTAIFFPSDFSTSAGLMGDSRQWTLSNQLRLKKVTVNSSLSANSFHRQGNLTESLNNDQFTWNESVSLLLPYNLVSALTYRYQNNANRIDDVELSGSRGEVDFQLKHRLYLSLDTIYQFRYGSTHSSNGDSSGVSHFLTVNYTRSIPRGRILFGFNFSRSGTGSSGETASINEPHSGIQVPGSFVLQADQVDPATIRVFLKSPVPPYESVLLTEGIHYTVAPLGNTFQINVFNLPSRFTVPGTYDFFVSYSHRAGEYRLGTGTFGGTFRLNLWENLLSPYYSYSSTDSDVLSGVFRGTPMDSSLHATGLVFQKGPLRAMGEYQKLEWQVSPYRAWRAEVQYIQALSDTFRIYTTMSYLHRYYPQGTSLDVRRSFTEETLAFTGNMQKQWTRNLRFSAGGSYSHLEGLLQADAYSLTSNVEWRIGKLDVTLGATAYRSQTQGPGTLISNRTHRYFYATIGRSLL